MPDEGVAAVVATPLSGPLSPVIIRLFAVAAGLAVATVYYAQPLLGAMADSAAIAPAEAGVIVTLAQIGYGVGLVFLVPGGDLWNRRRLVVGHFSLSVLALSLVALSTGKVTLLAGMAAIGLLAVVTQTLVAYAASLAAPDQRGRVVGTVTSGIVVGILLARTVAGALSDLAGWRSVYFMSAGMMAIVAVLLVRFLPHGEVERPPLSYRQLWVSFFRLIVEEPMLRVRGFLAFLIFAAITVLWTPMVLPLSAAPFFLSRTEVGLFGLAGAAGAIAASVAGRWADRGHAQRGTGAALAVMLVSWVPIGLLHYSIGALIVGVITIDFGLQAAHVLNQALIFQRRPEARSRLAAGYMIFYAAGCGFGSIISTLVYARGGWTGVSLLGGTISAMALLFWGLTRHRRPA